MIRRATAVLFAILLQAGCGGEGPVGEDAAGNLDSGVQDDATTGDGGGADTEPSDALLLDADPEDARATDGEPADGSGFDAMGPDAEEFDAGALDAEPPDAEESDAGTPDAEPPDAEESDAGAPDAEAPDAEANDAAAPDAEAPDTAAPDADVSDTGVADSGPGTTDAGEDAGVGDDGGPMDAAVQPDAGPPPGIPITLIGPWDSVLIDNSAMNVPCTPSDLSGGGSCTMYVTPGSTVEVYGAAQGQCFYIDAYVACGPPGSCTVLRPTDAFCYIDSVTSPATLVFQEWYDGGMGLCPPPSGCPPTLQCGNHGTTSCGACPQGEACSQDFMSGICRPTGCP